MSTALSPTSSANSQPNQLFGRKYKLEVSVANSSGGTDVITVTDSSFEPEALRIVFDVQTVAFQNYWFADIDIYNLDSTTTTQILQSASNITQGMTVKLQAGYINGNYDVIWEGPVFQPLYSRENVTDYKITLRCIFSMESQISGSVLSTAYAAGYSQTETVLAMIGTLGLNKDYVSPNLSTKTLPKAKVVFGNADKYLSNIARDNNMTWFMSQRGLALGGPNDAQVSSDPAIVYTPKTGLVFTPEQTQYGVNFTVLLDPRLKVLYPMQSVQLDQSLIRQYKVSVGDNKFLPLDQDGIYVIGGVRHRGDSRGGAWYSEVTGFVKVGNAVAWAALANINK